MSFIQELSSVPSFIATITKLAKQDKLMKSVRGMLRLRPGKEYTEKVS